METLDAIRARRQVRAFTDAAIPDDVLDEILDAGRRSSSARNTQPWTFVVVRDRARLQTLTGVWPSAGFVGEAAAAVAFVAPVSDDERAKKLIEFDFGQAVATIMIAATALGIGAGISSVGDWELGAEILGLPDDQRLMWLVALGYPADRPLRPMVRPARKPLDEVVRHEQW